MSFYSKNGSEFVAYVDKKRKQRESFIIMTLPRLCVGRWRSCLVRVAEFTHYSRLGVEMTLYSVPLFESLQRGSQRLVCLQSEQYRQFSAILFLHVARSNKVISCFLLSRP
jgi:hypothetical protein